MPLRSFIDIDIDDSRFQAFLELYNRYAEALKQMPADWMKVGSATSGVASDFAAMTAAVLAQQDLIHRVDREQSNLNRTASQTVRTFRSVADAAHNVYQTVADTTRHLLRWTGITGLFGGLLGAGGLYGLDRLAESASGLRTQSLGLGGVDPNTLAAQKINWGQFFDVSGVLGNIANLQGSLSGQVPFINLGIPGAWGAGATGALPQIVQRIHDLYRQTPPGTAQMQPWFGAAQQAGFGPEAIRAIGTMSQTELNQHIAASKSTAAVLGITDKELKDAQDFQITLERVTTTLQYKFLAALDRSGLINDFTAAAQKFVDWIGTGDAKKDLALFAADIKIVVGALEHLIGFFAAHPILFGAAAGAAAGAAFGPTGIAVGAAAGAAAASTLVPETVDPTSGRHRPTGPAVGTSWDDLVRWWNSITKDSGAPTGRAVRPHYQQGGIVPINAHAGEMILPQPISEGFQGFFNVGGAQQLRQLVGKVGQLVQVLLDKVIGVGGDPISDLFGFAPGTGGGGGGGYSNVPFASSIVDMAKRIAKLGIDPMTSAGLAMVSSGESGFRDIWNSQNPQGNPNSPFSASGFWQILKSNWQKYAPQVGVTTPQAIGSSFADQVKVAALMARIHPNWRDWSKAAGGSGAPDPAVQAKIAGLVVPTTNVKVTVDNRTGGSITSDQAGLNVRN